MAAFGLSFARYIAVPGYAGKALTMQFERLTLILVLKVPSVLLSCRMLSPLAKRMRVDRKTISVVDLHDASDSVRYWRRQSVTRRLEALELLRQSAHQYDPATARLPRLLKITQRRKS